MFQGSTSGHAHDVLGNYRFDVSETRAADDLSGDFGNEVCPRRAAAGEGYALDGGSLDDVVASVLPRGNGNAGFGKRALPDIGVLNGEVFRDDCLERFLVRGKKGVVVWQSKEQSVVLGRFLARGLLRVLVS